MNELFGQTWILGSRKDDSMGTLATLAILAWNTRILFSNRRNSRGKSGGQVRDEYREEYDPGRGGYGRAYDEQRRREEEEYGAGK